MNLCDVHPDYRYFVQRCDMLERQVEELLRTGKALAAVLPQYVRPEYWNARIARLIREFQGALNAAEPATGDDTILDALPADPPTLNASKPDRTPER